MTNLEFSCMNDIKPGATVCFFEGRDDKPVAFDKFGKVILCRHKISLGYATIKSVEERCNCYLVTADHTVCDLYSGITYSELKSVLKHRDYVISSEEARVDGGDFGYRRLCAKCNNMHIPVEVVAETMSSADGENCEIIDFIHVTRLDRSGYDFAVIDSPLHFVSGDEDSVTFDAACNYNLCEILSYVESL